MASFSSTSTPRSETCQLLLLPPFPPTMRRAMMVWTLMMAISIGPTNLKRKAYRRHCSKSCQREHPKLTTRRRVSLERCSFSIQKPFLVAPKEKRHRKIVNHGHSNHCISQDRQRLRHYFNQFTIIHLLLSTNYHVLLGVLLGVFM